MTWREGHRVAGELAQKAFQEKQAGRVPEAMAAMKLAYANEAFVSHFLTDLFSAGHIRGPRADLKPFCNGAVEGMPGAGLTANLQHDEDGTNCLLATNRKKQIFWTCGDEKFFDRINVPARMVVRSALEAGISELVKVMNDGDLKHIQHGALDFIPRLDFSQLGKNKMWENRLRMENTCPRFIIRDGKMTTRRNTDLTNPRTPYAINRNWPVSKAKAETATRPWTTSDLAAVFGSNKITIDPKKPGGDQITCEYWPWVEKRNNAYCCAALGRASVTTVAGYSPPTFTNTCVSGGKI